MALGGLRDHVAVVLVSVFKLGDRRNTIERREGLKREMKVP